MKISRRDFLKLCGLSAAAIGLSATDIFRLKEVLANPNGPTVLWVQGSACTGCSISLLNRISGAPPVSAADLLVNTVNLAYHPNLMALAGESAVDQLESAFNQGGYILAVEGGIPTNFNGCACWAWSIEGKDITFMDAVVELSSRAAAILCVGTCAAWGGIPAAPPNPTGVKGVRAVTGRTTINISGCPPHPDWIVWAVAQLLLKKTIALDSKGQPTALFNKKVHDLCPRKGTDQAKTLGVDYRCLKGLGCRGPQTQANCPQIFWNGGVNWCIDANSPCLGCTNPEFPTLNPFYKNLL